MRRVLPILIVLLALPGVIYAHVYMLETAPVSGEVCKETPTKVVMTFVGSVEPMFSKIEVFDPEGKKVSKKTRFLESDTIMEVDLEEGLMAGVYKVKYLCMSLDGHKQTGEFEFTIE